MPVSFKTEGERRPLSTRSWDIGSCGLCVRSKKPIPVGTRLKLDIEVIMPTRVQLGFDMNALVINGPSVSHFACVPGFVRRCQPCPDGSYDVGIQFSDDVSPQQRRVIDLYLDHLRDGFESQYL